MDAADEISREFDARTRPGRLSPRLKITGEGMVLGAGTVLAGMGRPRLVLDERRAAAILSTAFERPVDPPFLGRLRRAVALWNEGEPALAQLHLIFAGPPPCDDPNIVLRIFVAEEMLKAGVGPDVLLKAQGADPDLFTDAGAPLAKAHYNPDQPRDGHGRWSDGGAEAEPAAYRGKGWLKAIGRFLERLGSRARRFEREPGEAPEPSRPETRPEPVQPGNRPEVSKPDYPLPRPGKGEPVDIPGLPGVKGTDFSDRGAKETNYKTDLTRSEFEAKLREQGWQSEPTPDGKGVNYFSSDGSRYFARDKARSFDGPTADYYHADGSGKIDMKLRLRE